MKATTSLLRGVRILDFSQALSGPYCTMLLADLGADVIKVEPPGKGDDSRHWGPPFVEGQATYFLSVNRNKRSVALDLRDPADIQTARDLIASADVVVQNWKPGTAERLGVGYDAAKAVNPQVVYCSISGFGPDDHHRAGYDQVVQGTTGTMHLTGPPGVPTKWGLPVSDLAAGMFASTAIVAALHERTSSGNGHRVDIALEDCVLSLTSYHAARQLATGVRLTSDHNMHPSIVPYGMYRTADGFINICVGNDKQFARMCEALGMGATHRDERFVSNSHRHEHRMELTAMMQAALSSITTDDAVARLEAVSVPVGKVRHLDEALTDPVIRGRGMVVEMTSDAGASFEAANSPWHVDGARPAAPRFPPGVGDHTEEVIAGLSAETSSSLVAE